MVWSETNVFVSCQAHVALRHSHRSPFVIASNLRSELKPSESGRPWLSSALVGLGLTLI
jgi:hypothetical protein